MTTPTVLLVGNPNCGKTTLFNALTGLSARVGNYPGVTVEHREGQASLPRTTARGHFVVDVIDVPGTYSLLPRSDDEAVAVRALLGDLPPRAGLPRTQLSAVVVVVDATQLERNLYLLAQLRELPLPLVVALTMTDLLEKDGHHVDADLLAERVGVPVVLAPARAGGTQRLRSLLGELLEASASSGPTTTPQTAQEKLASTPWAPPDVSSAAPEVMAALSDVGERAARAVGLSAPGALGLLLAQASCVEERSRLPSSLSTLAWPACASSPEVGGVIAQVVQGRWGRAEACAKDIVTRDHGREPRYERRTRRIDAVVLHPVFGPVILCAVFLALFQALFVGAEPLMDVIEGGKAVVADLVGQAVPQSLPLLRSLLQDGVVAGVGNVVVFVPQIAILFFFLTLLEDSGYLARAAFLLDRLMKAVGLHGRAFVPLLSGFACAVPAILATRTIESTKDRLVTILVTPLVSCSARLPVYSLMIATVFSTMPPLWGFVSVGAVVMIAVYTLSLGAAITMAALFKRTLLRSPPPPLVLELPPYRTPQAQQVARAVGTRVKTFLVEAGTVILALTVLLWALLKFPVDQEVLAARDAAVAAVVREVPAGEDRDLRVAAIEGLAQKQLVEHSAAGRLGHALEPVIAPLGFDWKIGVGIVASFAAREVFVSTLGIVYGLGSDADETSTALRDFMRADEIAPGQSLYTPLTGLSLLVFFVLAMQCMSTLAAVKRETRSWRWPLFQFGYMTVLAWCGAFAVRSLGLALGFS
jgi:ferrous iron transport protein B